MYLYTYIYMYVCMYIYICIYTYFNSVQTGDVLLSIEGESVEKMSATDTMALMISSSSATFLRESSSRKFYTRFI